jgi:Flp pilus assembly protein TadG
MRAEQGAVSTELAVLTPVLLAFMLLAVFAGRVAQAEGDVANAAQEAARAASLQSGPGDAVAAAQEMAAANLSRSGLACRGLDVATNTSSFAPGGHVAVTVTCSASFADLSLLAVPGSRQFSASAVEVIDRHIAVMIP